MTEVERLKRARDTWKAHSDRWEALANKHRETADKLKRTNEFLMAEIAELEEERKLLRKELNETTDAYNELYDMVEHGST